MPTCADGHASVATDYCDVCGSPISAPAAPPPAGKACPACSAPISGRFCEVCGHDSALPAPPASAASAVPPVPSGGTATPVGWTAVVVADRDFYERVLARGGPDSVEFPQFFPERRIPLRENSLIGRHNRDQGIDPEIDLGLQPSDRGVSTQHAVLRVSDSGVTVTDLGSTNGTSLNGGEGLLAKGEETPLADGDRLHVGAWTTITIVHG